MHRKRNWKKVLCLILSLFCLLQINPIEALASEYWPDGPETNSPAVILMELSTGTILYEKNSEEAHYPASITKILTTLVALENSRMDEVVTFSNRAIDETHGSGIARDYGEQMTMEQCLYAVMLESANECAFAVAEHVGGTMEAFVDMMNAKAKEIGCVNTHFANPHGLHDDEHYTCAYDMALIAQAAYENETFRIITGTKRYTIPPTNKHDVDTILRNHHDMLVTYRSANKKYLYEYCVGGKTGYTDAAQNTLVTYAEKDGMTLVCVVMNTQSPSQFTDTRSLFDFAFDNFQLVNIAGNETRYDSVDSGETGELGSVNAFVDINKNANIVLPKTAEFSDTVSQVVYDQVSEDVVGTISYTYAGRSVGSANVERTGVEIETFIFDNQKEDVVETTVETDEEIRTIEIKPFHIVLVVLGAVLLCVLIFVMKRFMENFYIIRHNLEVRRHRREQYRIRKRRIKRRRRRR
ncbi:MAG: D-alanyl-D-alanine carboxypeptidase [Roseburia sp.]|nr:D-alanyl-D-alanine carboxypeptidase [Roseburia sp.]